MNPRLADLRTLLNQDSLDAILLSSPPNIIYFAEFAGFILQERGDAFLLLTKNKQYVFTYNMYANALEKHLGEFNLMQITKETPLPLLLKTIKNNEKLGKIGYEAHDLRVGEFQRITDAIPAENFSPTQIPSSLRMIKTRDEISRIKKASTIGDRAFSAITKTIRTGVTEKQLANEIDYEIRKQDANTAFKTIVAFAKNAAFPHHVPTDQKLKKGDAILLDFGVKADNYCSDMSRTIFLGKASPEQRKVYAAVLEAQKKSILFIEEKLKAGDKIKPSDIDQIGRDYISSLGLPPFNHMSHGIGLEVHEDPYFSPASANILQEGMVFSIEPGIYLNDNFGVRIEDLFAIENGKLMQITNSPSNLVEIEAK